MGDIEKGHNTADEMKAEIAMVTLSRGRNERKCIEPMQVSDWQRLVRIQGWIQRFVDNCQFGKSNRTSGELSVDEMGKPGCISFDSAKE